MNITYMLHVVRVAVARGDLSTPPSTAFTCATNGDTYTTRNLLDHLAFIYSYIYIFDSSV
jgi:hypothetical protein